MLCCFSSLFGYNNLKQVLIAYGIKSSNFYRLYNKLSYKDLTNLSACLFQDYAKEPLIKLGQQSESSWSRHRATYVIDASIFKIWLKEADSELYNTYFSGQTKKAEYGFKLTLAGIAIDDTFYPISFCVSHKKIKDHELAKITLDIVHKFTEDLKKTHNLKFGKWYLSVDSGYSSDELIAYVEELCIEIICVPKKNQLFKIGKNSISFKKFIKEIFLKKEEEYYKKNDKETSRPFTMRVKGFYKCRNKEVVFLFFRLKDSKKVSIIYTTDLNIKEKTLRRHWFQRTHIEQFFRFCKHTLKIQESTYSTLDDFIRKVCLFFIKAIFVTKIKNECRKRKGLKNITFGTIRLIVSKNKIRENYILKLLRLQDPFTE